MKNLIFYLAKPRSLRKAPPSPKVFISGLVSFRIGTPNSHGSKGGGGGGGGRQGWIRIIRMKSILKLLLELFANHEVWISSSGISLLINTCWVQGRKCCLGWKRGKKKMEGEKNSLVHGNISRIDTDSCVSDCFFLTAVFLTDRKENLYEVICMWIMFIKRV